jgi:hypothetical protein
MSSEREVLVAAGQLGPFSLWTSESLQPGTTVLLQVLRTVRPSDATSPLTTTHWDAREQFTLRLPLSHLLPGMELELKGQLFIVPTDPV